MTTNILKLPRSADDAIQDTIKAFIERAKTGELVAQYLLATHVNNGYCPLNLQDQALTLLFELAGNGNENVAAWLLLENSPIAARH